MLAGKMEEAEKSIWNIDEERLKELDYYMTMTARALDRWELQQAHEYFKGWRRVLSGAIDSKKLSDLDDKFKEIQNIKDKIESEEKKPVDLYNKMDEVFVFMNSLGATEGLYFRKQEDYDGL